MAMRIDRARSLVFRTSPPACDTASKPMNDENRTTHVPQKAVTVNGGIGAPELLAGMAWAASAASKSACEYIAPAMDMMTGPTIVIAVMMMRVRWYDLTPMTLTHHANHIAA